MQDIFFLQFRRTDSDAFTRSQIKSEKKITTRNNVLPYHTMSNCMNKGKQTCNEAGMTSYCKKTVLFFVCLFLIK